ncbi:amino acid permease [Thermoflavimicrobium daqui]|uniref:Amino acid permease n=1 Tax=Thermoflavimicrobium daqui TaxID=2137476 RepID=A0A364K397_9BACL|nr:amino acid permease [Thermoflavimicrobium daqui]RAL23293.1 amino acid permease [Thermoflavimicrobium daqui]
MEEQQLKRSLKPRHISMIALGGVIGTGFFLGTSQIIHQAGPGGAILSFTVGGLVMFLIMLCLGELAVAMPVSGSFQRYASMFIGPATGFMVGIMYWLNWVATISLDITSMSELMKRWFPHSSSWIWIITFSVLIFIINALSTRSYGESEFWLAGIKVVTIVLFIILGGAALFGLISMKDQSAPMFSNYMNHGGLFPNGLSAVFLTMIAVNFSFQGTEIVGIAAGESDQPEKSIPRAIRQTAWRTVLFFVLGITILAGLIPWTEAGKVESPFVVVFDKIGIPYAADIMNFVIITALFSAANSGLYSSTRMIWSLAQEKLVSPRLGKVNQRGVPFTALAFTFAISILGLLTNLVSPEKAFAWLLNAAALAALVGWISIPLSQFFFRKQYLSEGGKIEELKFHTPFYPVVPILAFGFNFIVLISLIFIPEQQPVFIGGSIAIVLCYLYYFIFIRKRIDRSVYNSKNIHKKAHR